MVEDGFWFGLDYWFKFVGQFPYPLWATTLVLCGQQPLSFVGQQTLVLCGQQPLSSMGQQPLSSVGQQPLSSEGHTTLCGCLLFNWLVWSVGQILG
jgi:hypothetical protein